MDLIIEDKDGNLIPNKNAKMIPEIKELFARQRRDGHGHQKAMATVLQEFIYIHYMVHYSSWAVEKYPLKEQEKERDIEVRERLKLQQWKPDIKIKEAIEAYEYFMDQEIIVRMLKAAYKAVNATTTYFENVDYNKKDNRGNLLYSPKQVMDALKQVKDVKTKLDEIVEEVRLGAGESGRMKGGGVKNLFEDPDKERYERYVKAREDSTKTDA